MFVSLGERVQGNLLARRERLLLNFLCGRLPHWVAPDHLTVLGLSGAFLAFCGYIGSRFDPAFLWLASLGLVLNWLGDSLDGSLARYRHCERMRYGYFLDSMTDAFCCLIIMVGLGLSPFVRMDVALFALVGYYMLCIYVFLNHHVTGIHRLSFLGSGPTETRIGLIILNIWMFAQGRLGAPSAGSFVSVYDLLLIASFIVSVALFVRQMMGGIEQLRGEEAAQPAEASSRMAGN